MGHTGTHCSLNSVRARAKAGAGAEARVRKRANGRDQSEIPSMIVGYLSQILSLHQGVSGKHRGRDHKGTREFKISMQSGASEPLFGWVLSQSPHGNFNT